MGVLTAVASSAPSGLFDSDAVTFIITTAKEIMGLFTTPPLSVFLTISIIGAVVTLVTLLISRAKGGRKG